MQSPNICSQNQWICQQQLSFWRKLLISFFSWWANSTMFVKELRALLHNGALKPHSMTRTSGLRNGFLKNSQTTVDSKLIAIDSEWKFFAGCWHVLNAVANALRISAVHNWSVFMFVSGAADDSVWFWFARPTYKTYKEVQQWRFVWFVSTTAAVQSLCRHFHPESQGSSRRIECHHESGNVSVFSAFCNELTI